LASPVQSRCPKDKNNTLDSNSIHGYALFPFINKQNSIHWDTRNSSYIRQFLREKKNTAKVISAIQLDNQNDRYPLMLTITITLIKTTFYIHY